MKTLNYKGTEAEVVKIENGWFAGGFMVKAGEKTSWAFETEAQATKAIPEVIKFWAKWEGKEDPAPGKYVCHECGADFNVYTCPVCGESDMISLRK